MRTLLSILVILLSINSSAQEGLYIRPELEFSMTPNQGRFMTQPENPVWKPGISLIMKVGDIFGLMTGVSYASYQYNSVYYYNTNSDYYLQQCRYIEVPLGAHLDLGKKPGGHGVWFFAEPAVCFAFISQARYQGRTNQSQNYVDIDNKEEFGRTLLRGQLGYGLGLRLGAAVNIFLGGQMSISTSDNISEHTITPLYNSSNLAVTGFKLGCAVHLTE